MLFIDKEFFTIILLITNYFILKLDLLLLTLKFLSSTYQYYLFARGKITTNTTNILTHKKCY